VGILDRIWSLDIVLNQDFLLAPGNHVCLQFLFQAGRVEASQKRQCVP